ncbi:MAG: peptidylprolyl isomerase [Clostridia bacterium]|nr:peptidylprolyl isomerase [Clostridia bacterium]
MKIKKIIINIVAVVMLVVSSLCFTACEDIVKLEVKFDIYSYDTEAMYSADESTLTVELYRHLAPQTVDAIKKNVENKDYDNMLVYKFADTNKTQYMMGDLRYDENGNIVKVILPEIYGEFEKNGVSGSNLKVERGYIGVWRSYYACDSGLITSSNSRNSSRGTWFMPTSANNSLEGKVCIFGKVDLSDTVVSNIFDAIDAIFESADNYVNYEVYYTGEYDETKPNEDYGLKFNCVLEEDFNEDEINNLFETEDDKQQLNWYNHYTISVPVVIANNQTLKVSSIRVVK